MLRKWNRILAFILSLALVTTTFGSDFATARVYAEGIEQEENIEDASESRLQTAGDDGEEGEDEPDEPEDEEESEEGEGQDNNDDAPPADGGNDQGAGEDGQGAPEGEQGGEGQGPAPEGEQGGEGQGPAPEGGQGGEGQPPVPEGGENPDPAAIDTLTPEEGAPIPEADPDAADADAAKRGAKKSEENSITITYIAKEGGKVSRDSETIAEGGTAEGATASDKEGYAFTNWTDDSDNTVCSEREFTPADELLVDGAVYYANFEKTDFTVNFMVDGDVFDTRGFARGDKLTIPPQDPFKAGYYFRGWNYDGSIITADNAS